MTAKPRVAILHYAAPPTIGGVEFTIAAHARLFADRGYAVKIIAGRGEALDARVPVEIVSLLDSRHAFVEHVSQNLKSGTVTKEFRSLTTAIRHILQRTLADVDICIAHNVVTLHKNLALTCALHEIAGTHPLRVIAWCHDFAWGDPVYAREMHSRLPWDLIRQPWEGVQYVAVSETRKKELQELWGVQQSDIAVVPPGVDAFEFLGIGEIAVRHARELDLLNAAPLLLLPTPVTQRKNIELAIKITTALREQGLSPKLIVLSPLGQHNPERVTYLNELHAMQHVRGVEDAVVFLQERSSVDDATHRDFYLLADALLFPSEREGFGIPILEAGLARLPIFCSDIPSFRELAREHALYFALDESPHAIAARLADFLADDARYQLKQRVLREYTWERIFSDRIEPLIVEKKAAKSG